MPEEASDGQLVRWIAEGGPAARSAEAALCERFGPRIRLYGLRHLRDADRAADLVQAVLLAVLTAARAGRVEDPDVVDRFVLGTCRNTVLRLKGQAARTQPATAEELADVLPPLPAFEAIDTAALYRCLKALEPRARTVVILSFREDRSADQIAVRLQTTPGNVRVLRHRALASLRHCLDAGREVQA